MAGIGRRSHHLRSTVSTIISTSSNRPAGSAPTALFACTQHWNSSFQVGSHHIARCFAERGWRVAFVSAPISPMHLMGLGTDRAERLASWRSGGRIDAETGVWHYVPFAPLPWGTVPGLRGRRVVDAAWRMIRPLVAAALRRAGFDRPNLAYADHFLQEGLLQAASPRLSVFRRADNLAGFPGAGTDFAQRELEFARRVDLTLCTTESSATYMAKHGVRDVLIVPNGIHVERFLRDAPLPEEYRGDPRPIVVYVGAAEHRLDIDLMVRGMAELPQLRWVVIGPFVGSAAERLRAAGALLLGSRPHAALAGYLRHARVGIVPFSMTRNAELLREVSPLKVFEYSACGLPVVGTLGCQYPAVLPTPLEICASGDAFLQAVRRHAEGPRPRRPQPSQFAALSWSARLEPLFAWLDSRGLTAHLPPVYSAA